MNLGEGYTYMNEGGNQNWIFHEYPEKGGEIPATVISYNYDSKFIIARQRPLVPQDLLYTKKYIYNSGIDCDYYWLIIKRNNIVLGPYNIDQFSKIKKEYKVPKDLDLNSN